MQNDKTKQFPELELELQETRMLCRVLESMRGHYLRILDLQELPAPLAQPMLQEAIRGDIWNMLQNHRGAVIAHMMENSPAHQKWAEMLRLFRNLRGNSLRNAQDVEIVPEWRKAERLLFELAEGQGLNLNGPVPREKTELQRAHDLLVGILKGDLALDMEITAAHMERLKCQTDVLCWALGHDHNQCFAETLKNLEDEVKKSGYELVEKPGAQPIP